MIANISQANASFAGDFLDKDRAPRFMHYEEGQAETELIRLQTKCPDDEFVLLKAVAVAVKNEGGVLVVEPVE